jgi:hypothetical protein
MKKGLGPCKIDAVDIGEVSVNLLGSNPTVMVKYALTDSKAGTRHGAGTRLVWGDDVLQKLDELLDCMEAELCQELFPTSGSATDDPPYPTGGLSSL